MNSTSIQRNKKLQEILLYVKEEGSLTEILENEIIYAFGGRGEKAVNVLKEKRLQKLVLNDNFCLWKVKGLTNSYIIINSHYCECRDFSIRVINRKEDEPCYHLLAKVIGEKTGNYTIQHLTNREYVQILNDLYEKRTKYNH
ncbi:MAG: hypothetical protein ACTSQE_02155 [Candidatus Heimdallarchaeaceae archaeon]